MSAGDREAEAQNKKGDESSAPDRDSRAAAALKQHWDVGLRATELCVAVIAIGLIIGALYSPSVVNSDHRHIALIYSAYSSFIIITGVLVLARLFGETLGWRTSIGFSTLGVIMFTAAAAVIFYDVDDNMNSHGPYNYYDNTGYGNTGYGNTDWHRSYYANIRPNKQAYDLLIASGVFAVFDAVVFLVHIFVTFRKEAEY